jgi:hypothetical protein
MYYYPYYLHLLNLFSFRHYNGLDNNKIILPDNKDKSLMLWSITFYSYKKGIPYSHTRIAYYNYYTKDYSYGGNRYLTYQDIVNVALNHAKRNFFFFF